MKRGEEHSRGPELSQVGCPPWELPEMTRAGPVTFQVLGLQMQCMLLTYYVGSEDPSSDLLVSSKPSPQSFLGSQVKVLLTRPV